MTRGKGFAVVTAALLAALTGCADSTSGAGTKTSGASSGPAGAGSEAGSAAQVPASAASTDWVTYHHDPERTGRASGVPAPGTLANAWTARLDGAVYGQPLVVGDLVIAATEGDTVYGLDRSTGRVRWQRHLGTPVPLRDLPCGNIDPLGITGTPTYDPGTGRVFVVAETTGYHHRLFGLSARNGTIEVNRDLPAPDGHPRNDQQRAALALAHGRVYVAFGGLLGDCGQYVGSVVGVPISGSGATVAYLVPTARMGGLWATGGPTLGADGTLYVTVGNGAATSGAFDGSDSATALSPDLRMTAQYAPRTWAQDNAADLDLGSMSPAVLANGRLLAVGKRGTGYLLPIPRLGGPGRVGGEIAQARVCRAFGGPANEGTTVYVPCAGGLAAVSVAGDRLAVLWRGPGDASGSPVLGGGAVWVTGSGTLYALDKRTGRVRARIGVGELPHFASPTLSGGLALIGTMNGVVAVKGA